MNTLMPRYSRPLMFMGARCPPLQGFRHGTTPFSRARTICSVTIS